MEKVTGGTGATISVDGRTMTKDQFNNFVLAMFDEVGHDVAYNLFVLYTGYQSSKVFSGTTRKWKICRQCTGLQWETDAQDSHPIRLKIITGYETEDEALLFFQFIQNLVTVFSFQRKQSAMSAIIES